jgi:hypothetical protein
MIELRHVGIGVAFKMPNFIMKGNGFNTVPIGLKMVLKKFKFSINKRELKLKLLVIIIKMMVTFSLSDSIL